MRTGPPAVGVLVGLADNSRSAYCDALKAFDSESRVFASEETELQTPRPVVRCHEMAHSGRNRHMTRLTPAEGLVIKVVERALPLKQGHEPKHWRFGLILERCHEPCNDSRIRGVSKLEHDVEKARA